MLPDRLTRIDDTNRDQYYFLDAEDRCYFLGDFFGGKDWTAGYTNQLIKNFKRSPQEIATSAKSTYLQRYKEQAIRDIAGALHKVLTQAAIEKRTFVPIPSSKVMGDPNYCDRLEQTLRRAFHGYDADIRPLLRQTISTEADHRSGASRRSYDELLEITAVDRTTLATPVRTEIVLFDDVLTSGKHFKVAQTRLRELDPTRPIIGLFVARCIHASPFDDIEEVED